MSGRESLRPLFEPRSVAVFGASRHPDKLGHVLLRNVASGGFGGSVVAINPAAEAILGLPTVAALADPVDLALVSVPASNAAAAVEHAVSTGCRAVVVLSSGFAEAGAEGRALQDRIAALARDAGVRLVGPNCMGVLSKAPGGWMNGTYFWRVPEVEGTVSFASQSGAMGGLFLAEVARRRFGLARFVSLGNCADVNETDVLEYLAEDPETQVIGLFTEAVQGGRRFVEAARAVAPRKPVVMLKAGKRRAGAAAAIGHTGSLAGSHGAVQAALARAGVVEAPDSEGFFDALAALAALAPHTRVPVGPRVAIVTVSGGPSVLAADAAEARGLSLPAAGEATRDRLRRVLPAFAAMANPIDLTPQCPPTAFGEAVGSIFDDPAFDGVIVIDCGIDSDEFGHAVVEARSRTKKPVTAFLFEVPRVSELLSSAGIPSFDSPERAVDGYATMVRS